MSLLLQKRAKIVDLGIILLLGLLSITWFRGDFLINHGDQAFPLSPLFDFKNWAFSYWNHLWGYGFPQTGNFANLFYYFFPLLTLLGIPLVITEKMLYYFLFTFAGIAVYFLVDSLRVKNSRLIGMTAALAYMFNFYPLFTFWNSFINLAFFYSCAPLLLSLYIQLLKTQKLKYFLFWLFISLVIFSPAATNPGHVVTLFLLHFTYFLFCLFFTPAQGKRKKTLILSLNLFLFWLLLNAWWFLPSLSNLEQSLVSAGAATQSGSEGILQNMSLFTSFLNLFRFFGPWTFYFQVFGDPYFPWSEIYVTLPFVILSFLGPVIAVLGLLLKRKNPLHLYFTLLFVLGLFLMKGVHPPFGIINRFIVLKIPFFVVFRNSYEKFGVLALLGYSIIVGFGFSFLDQVLKKFLKKKLIQLSLTSILCVLMFGVYMWPFWTGDLIYEGGKVKPGARVKIPDYYFQAGEWLKGIDEEFKLFSLPNQDGAAYHWEQGYVGSDEPAVHLLQRPIVSPFDPKDKILFPFLDQLYRAFFKSTPRSQQSQSHFLGLSNIKYVLLHQDLAFPVNMVQPWLGAEEIKKILKLNPNLQKAKTFNKLDFYKLNDDYFLPQFYVPQKIVYLEGDIRGIVDMTSFQDFPLKSAIFLSEANPSAIKENIKPVADEIFIKKKEIDQVLDETLPVNFITREYQLEIPSEGNYRLLVGRPKDLFWPKLNNWEIAIKNKSLRPEDFKEKQDGWLEWQSLFLLQGETSLKITFNELPDLVGSQDWQPLLLEKPQAGEKAFFKEIENWQPDSLYQVSGFIQTGDQKATLFLVEEVKDFWLKERPFNKSMIKQKIALPANTKNKVQFYFRSQFNSLSAKLILLTETDFFGENFLPTKAEDLKVSPLWEPEIVLRKASMKREGKAKLEISFTKLSPVKYRVGIKGAWEGFPLVFSETFHPGWKLYLADEKNNDRLGFFKTWGKRPVAENRHFLVNGFANSWCLVPQDVDNRENYELILEFTPQRFFYLGILISGITLIGGSLFLLAQKLRKVEI